MEKLFEEFSHKTLKQWNDKIISDLKGNSYENLIWESPENIKVDPIYNTESTKKLKGDCTYNHLDWEIEQSLNNPTNKQILTCLNKGASTLLLKDIPTQDLETILESSNQKIDYIFFLNVQKEVIIKRVEKRKTLEKRSDDESNIILKRYETYMDMTRPVLDFYSKNSNFYEIDGALKIEQITAKIDAFLNV